MPRRCAALLAVAVLALALAGQAAAFSQQDVTITSADGTPLAGTLFLPDAPAPAGGYPAVVFLHGLGGDRAGMSALAQSMGVVGEQYVVLTVDARGHGASGGLIGIDGPNEIADLKAEFSWLAARPDVADGKIGAFGISLGGGAAWNSLVAGVPWATLEVVETWTDLRPALLPQGLAKSGVIAGFLGALDPKRVDPSVFAVRDAAFASRLDGIPAFAAARSSLPALRGLKTPVFMMQGRCDFAFGIDQALRPYAALAGPKRLWLGLHGHAPSSFPAADTTAMLAEGKLWFDHFLRGERNGLDLARPVIVSPERWRGVPARFAALPGTRVRAFPLRGSTRLSSQAGKVQRATAALAGPLEVFGTPRVTVSVDASPAWTRLVGVLSARTPAGKEIVIGGGGVPLAPGRHTVTVNLTSQATFVPKGSKLTLTLGSSSLAQSPGNLLYLDLPFAPGARITVGAARLALPVLAKPVTR